MYLDSIFNRLPIEIKEIVAKEPENNWFQALYEAQKNTTDDINKIVTRSENNNNIKFIVSVLEEFDGFPKNVLKAIQEQIE